MHIIFEPLNVSHFPLMLTWLELPHVKKWWDQDVTYTMDLVREKYSSYVKGYKFVDGQQKPIKGFIIYSDQNPVGYIQIYNAYDFPRSKTLSGLPANLGAFDIFIGENEHIWLLIFNNVWHPFPACFGRVGACLNGVPLNDAGSS